LIALLWKYTPPPFPTAENKARRAVAGACLMRRYCVCARGRARRPPQNLKGAPAKKAIMLAAFYDGDENINVCFPSLLYTPSLICLSSDGGAPGALRLHIQEEHARAEGRGGGGGGRASASGESGGGGERTRWITAGIASCSFLPPSTSPGGPSADVTRSRRRLLAPKVLSPLSPAAASIDQGRAQKRTTKGGKGDENKGGEDDRYQSRECPQIP